MWFYNRLLWVIGLAPLKLAGIAFGLVMLLSACSFAPLYSSSTPSSGQFELSYAEPTSRLSQIVYADLISRLGRAQDSGTYRISVSVSSSALTPGTGSVGLEGLLTITEIQSDETVFSGTRTASATYVSSPQSLANQQAANEASERAAHQLAQTLRLTIIGVLSSQ